MAPKDASLHCRIPADLRAALEGIAAREGRTLSQVIVRALADYADWAASRAAKQKKGRGA